MTEYNIRSDAIRWRTSTFLKVIPSILKLAFIVSEILTFKNVDFETCISGSREYNMRAVANCRSMQISTSIKVTIRIFALALTVSEILTFQVFDREHLGKMSTFAAMPFGGEY